MKKTLFITHASLIAALYVTLAYVSHIFGLASGTIQFRLSEALCVLPVITTAAVPGVTIGCLVFNLFFSANVFDTVFGTLATLIGAAIALKFKKKPLLACIPTIISNTLILPPIIVFALTDGNASALPFTFLTVFISETLSCAVLGYPLLTLLRKHKIFNK